MAVNSGPAGLALHLRRAQGRGDRPVALRYTERHGRRELVRHRRARSTCRRSPTRSTRRGGRSTTRYDLKGTKNEIKLEKTDITVTRGRRHEAQGGGRHPPVEAAQARRAAQGAHLRRGRDGRGRRAPAEDRAAAGDPDREGRARSSGSSRTPRSRCRPRSRRTRCGCRQEPRRPAEDHRDAARARTSASRSSSRTTAAPERRRRTRRGILWLHS